jgi:hypothetical protein
MLQLSGLLSGYIAVGLPNDKSTYNMSSVNNGLTFSETGSYLIIFTYGGDNYFIGNVNFINGSATVNFNSMTSQSTLPIGSI